MESYDYIIAGGGCAGLSLAYYLSRSNLRNAKVLIVDRDEKVRNDRTWCFWTEQSTAFDQIVANNWQELSFKNAQGTIQANLPQQYQMIRSADFYRFTKSAIRQFSNFHWLQGNINRTGEDESGAYAIVDGKMYRAKQVFDSCFNWRDWQRQSGSHQFLLQHFKGWFIETDTPVFNPEQATLMDFRTPQQGNARFLYVLPFSERAALVEYTVFSSEIEPESVYDQALKNYLHNHLNIQEYRILETEKGAIPMTDLSLRWNGTSKVVPIGTPGGAVKPTTGYAFLRIQQQARSIVRGLEQTGEPVFPKTKRRFRFYDRLLLSILQHEGGNAAAVFSALFQRNTMNTILTFLDERTNIWQEANIFARLPFMPFLRAIVRVYLMERSTKFSPKPRLQTAKKIV